MANGRDDPEITDAVLRSEIELLADLLTAACNVTGPMSDAQIAEALGVVLPDCHTYTVDRFGNPSATANVSYATRIR